MENFEIARTLRELAVLLEIQGANPFRVRAYRNAVQTINGLTRSLASMLEAGEDLTALPDIGKNVASHIQELVDTGKLQRIEEITTEFPRELVDLVRLEGVGPKKARKLWDELRVSTVDELEAAVREGRVATLEGFGQKSAAKILESIHDHRAHSGRILRSEAEEILEPLLAYLQEAEGVERIEVAGSFRRRKETIGDLDVLAQADQGAEDIIAHFVRYPGVARVTGAGDTKGSVLLRSGIAVDLRVLPRRSFGAALQYFTGSKEHNVVTRTMGVKRGLRLNEWGVFRIPEDADPDELGKEEGERVGGETEEEMYYALGLPWIEPVLRENRGEIEAARDGALPKLVTVADVRGELHMHSTWSDGKLSIAEMVEACRARGCDYACITDHTPAVGVAGGLSPDQVREQWQEVAELAPSLGDFQLFRGLEVDILRDGALDMDDDVLAELDFVIVSVHGFMDQDKVTMTDRVIRAVQHPHVDLLGHPTGRLLGRREPFAIDMDEVLMAAAAAGVAVEINCNPRRLDLSDVHAMRARELGIPIALNTDAHSVRDLGFLRFGVDQARRAWLTADHVLNARSANGFRRWLDRRSEVPA